MPGRILINVAREKILFNSCARWKRSNENPPIAGTFTLDIRRVPGVRSGIARRYLLQLL